MSSLSKRLRVLGDKATDAHGSAVARTTKAGWARARAALFDLTRCKPRSAPHRRWHLPGVKRPAQDGSPGLRGETPELASRARCARYDRRLSSTVSCRRSRRIGASGQHSVRYGWSSRPSRPTGDVVASASLRWDRAPRYHNAPTFFEVNGTRLFLWRMPISSRIPENAGQAKSPPV
jgi:hypothetical protein